ncbi:MAG: tripartite tricarboxylate transporter substrate binding protein [Planctomycetota bacterium]|jgi:tripartite-type tricarboxylate transporter receptor subunit TctC|nr:tripartite tricarboxylate transporter substrate binding protein [Planctomycetota bacterium]
MKHAGNLCVALTCACAFAGAVSAGDAYPVKPIQVLIPANPGGDTDMTARFLAKEMEKYFGQPLPIVNMAGAAGTVAANNLVSSPKDGYKTLYFHTDAIVANLLGMSPYKWDEIFAVAGIPASVADFGLFTHKDSPFSTIAELVAHAKGLGNGKLRYATDTGSINQVLGRLIQKRTGLAFIEIDGGNAADRVAALLGKRIDLVSLPYSVAKPYMESGDFKCMGIMAEGRNDFLPDVPTFREQSLDIAYVKFFFFGFAKGTVQSQVDAFSAAMAKAVGSPEYAESIARYNMIPKFLDPGESAEFMKAREAEYKKYIEEIL